MSYEQISITCMLMICAFFIGGMVAYADSSRMLRKAMKKNEKEIKRKT